MSAETHLKAYQEQVDRRLEDLLPPVEQQPSDLHAAMRYSCLAPGKRLRPALCLAAAEVVSGGQASPPLSKDDRAVGGGGGRGWRSAEAAGDRDPDAATPQHRNTATPCILDAACALEMVHCFSLIHDDLPAIDDDELRRGRPTCHVEFGEALAILAGDALFALAYQVLSECGGPADRVLRSVQVLARAVGSDGLVGGEVVDVQSEGKPLDEQTLRFIHSRKTGALISASCEIGALLGGGSEEDVKALRAFGSSIGLAFQIVDDLLNETSTAEALGKAAGSDRLRQKATYPALYGVAASREAAKKAVEDGLCALDRLEKPSTILKDLALYAVERMH